MPRLRQAVIAVQDLDPAVTLLRQRAGLGEPFADPDIAYFGLRNAVFAIGDTFLELVSPVQDDTAAAARERARELELREVFHVEFDDVAEAHLHPVDIGGAIVSLSEPRPAESWRWGGPAWEARSVPGRLQGITVGVPDPDETGRRWRTVAGGEVPVQFEPEEEAGPGIAAIAIELGEREVRIDPADLASSLN